MKRLTIMTGTVVLLGLAAFVSFYQSAPSKNVSSGSTLNQDANAVNKNKLEQTVALEDSIPMNLSTSYPGSAAAFNADTFVKPTDKELKERLSAIEYKVTQKEGTERPFSNELNDEKRAGLYVDIVSGEPLFSSIDKYDSGTGWPSFARPIDASAVIEKRDISLFGVRTEIRSALADSHLGHVFNDGPAPTGQRYCMNAASMRFIPLDQMVKSGYEAYLNQVSVKNDPS